MFAMNNARLICVKVKPSVSSLLTVPTGRACQYECRRSFRCRDHRGNVWDNSGLGIARARALRVSCAPLKPLFRLLLSL